MTNKYTEDECDYIMSGKPIKEIARKLKRSPSAIKRKKENLRAESERVPHDDRKKALKEQVAESYKEFAEHVKKHPTLFVPNAAQHMEAGLAFGDIPDCIKPAEDLEPRWLNVQNGILVGSNSVDGPWGVYRGTAYKLVDGKITPSMKPDPVQRTECMVNGELVDGRPYNYMGEYIVNDMERMINNATWLGIGVILGLLIGLVV